MGPMVHRQAFADNPVLVRVLRGERIESVHRGAWVLCNGVGELVRGHGQYELPIFARSAVKCLQALPLVESGAADRFEFSSAELALTLASHSAEAQHTELVAGLLERLDLTPADLRCGSGTPMDRKAQETLAKAGHKPSALHHNCSGKHAGFLALARHLDVPVEQYLDPSSASQRAVRQALLDMTGLAEEQLFTAIDGCSAPTFRLPLSALARGFARFASPRGLEPTREHACRRLLAAAKAHPELIAGSHKRLCTELIKVSGGELFPKIGAEAVYAVAHVGLDQAFAVKIDDGGWRGVQAFVVAMLQHLGWLRPEQTKELEAFRGTVLHNAAGLEVGSIEVEF